MWSFWGWEWVGGEGLVIRLSSKYVPATRKQTLLKSSFILYLEILSHHHPVWWTQMRCLSSLGWGLLVPANTPTPKRKSWLSNLNKWPSIQAQLLPCCGPKLAAATSFCGFQRQEIQARVRQGEDQVWCEAGCLGEGGERTQSPAEGGPSVGLWKSLSG